MGAWSLFFTITTILETSKAGLIKNALIKYINSEEVSEHTEIETASIIINIIVTLLMGAVMALFAETLGQYWEVPSLATMLYAHTLALLILIPFSHFEYIQHHYIHMAAYQ